MSTATRPVEVDTALRSLLEYAGVEYDDACRIELTPAPGAPSGLALTVEYRDRSQPAGRDTGDRRIVATATKTLLV
jgi:hypothetical protein